MVRDSIKALLAVTILGSAAWAEERALIPQGPSPRFAMVMQVDWSTEKLTLLENSVNYALEGPKGFLLGPAAPARVVPVIVQELVAISLGDSQIVDGEGKPLAGPSARQRLVPGKIVLISADGQKIDPFYLQALRKENLLVLIPGQSYFESRGGRVAPPGPGPGVPVEPALPESAAAVPSDEDKSSI